MWYKHLQHLCQRQIVTGQSFCCSGLTKHPCIGRLFFHGTLFLSWVDYSFWCYHPYIFEDKPAYKLCFVKYSMWYKCYSVKMSGWISIFARWHLPFWGSWNVLRSSWKVLMKKCLPWFKCFLSYLNIIKMMHFVLTCGDILICRDW